MTHKYWMATLVCFCASGVQAATPQPCAALTRAISSGGKQHFIDLKGNAAGKYGNDDVFFANLEIPGAPRPPCSIYVDPADDGSNSMMCMLTDEIAFATADKLIEEVRSSLAQCLPAQWEAKALPQKHADTYPKVYRFAHPTWPVHVDLILVRHGPKGTGVVSAELRQVVAQPAAAPSASKEFCAALDRVVTSAAAANDFQAIRAPQSSKADDETVWRVNLALDGVGPCAVRVPDEPSDARRFSCDAYKGDASTARSRASQLASTIKACLGDKWTYDTTRSGTSIQHSAERYAVTVTVRAFDSKRQNVSYVSFSVE